MDDLEAEGKRRIADFTNYVNEQLENAEPAKPFIFPEGRYPQGDIDVDFDDNYESSSSDYDQMKLRDREISSKLKKIKAMAFILESEQSTLRKRIQKQTNILRC